MSDFRKQILVAFDRPKDPGTHIYRLAFDIDWYPNHFEDDSINRLTKYTRCITYLEKTGGPVPVNFHCCYIDFESQENIDKFYEALGSYDVDAAVSVLSDITHNETVIRIKDLLIEYHFAQLFYGGRNLIHKIERSADVVFLSANEIPTLGEIQDKINQKTLKPGKAELEKSSANPALLISTFPSRIFPPSRPRLARSPVNCLPVAQYSGESKSVKPK